MKSTHLAWKILLTPDFGTVNNLFKMASNGEVIFMKEFRIDDMNIFEVWVIAVRFHLEGRNYAQSTKILYIQSTVWLINPPRRP